MRPKKRILLANQNEIRLSLLRYQLTIHGYAVFSAVSAQEARTCFENYLPELLIAAFELPGLAELLADLHQHEWPCSQMVIAPARKELGSLSADAILCDPTAAELLERVKLLVARKRGPKPVRSVLSEMRLMIEQARRIA